MPPSELSAEYENALNAKNAAISERYLEFYLPHTVSTFRKSADIDVIFIKENATVTIVTFASIHQILCKRGKKEKQSKSPN